MMPSPATAIHMKNCAQERQAVQEAAEQHLPLVAALVKRFPHDSRETEELYQQGCIGLMKALARYDPSRGTSFSTYAASMILGEMRMLRRLGAPIHIPRPEREMRQRIRRAADDLARYLHREPTIQQIAALVRMDASEVVLLMEDVTVSSTDALSDTGTPLQETIPDNDDWLSRIELRDLLLHLPPRDRQLLLLRHRDGLSQAETAQRLHMTQVQVSRREADIRRRLRAQWRDA